MTTVRDPDALQYSWYVGEDSWGDEPPEPTWERDMGVEVQTVVQPNGRYTTTKFYSKSNPEKAWIRSGSPVSLSAVR